jgi:hypothetical protein
VHISDQVVPQRLALTLLTIIAENEIGGAAPLVSSSGEPKVYHL